MKFYVYVLYRPDGRPFYVGKGSGNRWKCHLQTSHRAHQHNRYKAGVVRAILAAGKDVDCRIIARFPTEQEAFALECLLIQQIGRREHGGPLTNLTDGGEGLAGLPPEIKAKQPRFVKGQTYTPQRNAKISAALKGRPKSQDHKDKVAAALRGGTQSQESIEKRRIQSTGRQQSTETKAKKNAKLRGRKRTPDQCERIALAARARRPQTVETCRQIAATVSNLIWITDGRSSTRIHNAADIPAGWRKGRLPVTHRGNAL